MGTGARRRLHRSLARQRRDRQPTVRVFRRGIPTAGGDRRLRAARCAAGHPHAGAAAECASQLRRESIHARRHAATATARRSAWSPRCSSCDRASSGAAWASCRTAGCASSPPMRQFDAERRFAIEAQAVPENAACQCPAIIRGVKKPTDCALFGTRVHAAQSDRLVHGVRGRRLRGLLQVSSGGAVPRRLPADAHPAAGARVQQPVRSACTSSSPTTATSCRSSSTSTIA